LVRFALVIRRRNSNLCCAASAASRFHQVLLSNVYLEY
jgi:hypothetical protein